MAAVYQLGSIIDNLISKDFLQRDIDIFTVKVKSLLKITDLKKYALDVLSVKARSVFYDLQKVDLPNNYSYRKLIRVILSIGDQEVIDYLETYFGKNNDPEYFLVLLEEQVSLGKDITNSEKLFISLLDVHYYPIEPIKKFLSIIGKDSNYLAKNLLNDKRYKELGRYIWQLSELKDGIEDIEKIINVVLEYPHDDFNKYLDLVIELMASIPVNEDHIYKLLNHSKYSQFNASILSNLILSKHFYKINIIMHMCSYLEKYKKDDLEKFEMAFVDSATSGMLLDYVLLVPSSNKRRVLQRLVEIRQTEEDEEILVEFIKHFPEYNVLLLML